MRAYGVTRRAATSGLVVAALSIATACSSGGAAVATSSGLPPPPTDATGDGGSAVTPAPTSAALNPDGFPYPSPPYGRNARSGTTPGSRMRNFAYLGYRNGDPSQGLQTIAMIDYYDPCGKRYKLIHLSVAAVWCTPCNEETAAMVLAKSDIDANQVLMLQALDDGPVLNVGATPGDLDRWVARYKPTFTEMLDPGLTNLGGFFAAAEVPWNCDIDPRTMEILDQSTGWTGDVTSELSPGLAAVQGPQSYPLAVSCN
jgi:hypothetical protein